MEKACMIVTVVVLIFLKGLFCNCFALKLFIVKQILFLLFLFFKF